MKMMRGLCFNSVRSVIFKREEMGKLNSEVTITMERVLAGLSCEEGESVGAFWNERLDWGLFNWLLWCCWSFLKKQEENSSFSL